MFLKKLNTSAKGALDIINKITSRPNCKIAITFGKIHMDGYAPLENANSWPYFVVQNTYASKFINEPKYVGYANSIIKGKSNDKLIFLILLDKDTPSFSNKVNHTFITKMADSFIHELQHIDSMFNSLVEGQLLLSEKSDHELMDTKSGTYWSTRYNFFYSYYDFWKEDLLKSLADNLDLASPCGSINNSNAMDINVRNYICDQVSANTR
jgi:hypothetical protein